MEENTLILSLIKDHLIHSRLVNGLYAIGIEADFTLNLSDTIFKLAGLYDDLEESRYGYYLTLIERINHFKPDKWREKVEPLAREIYDTILKWQEEDVRHFLGQVEYE